MRNKDVLRKLKNLPDNTKEYIDTNELVKVITDFEITSTGKVAMVYTDSLTAGRRYRFPFEVYPNIASAAIVKKYEDDTTKNITTMKKSTDYVYIAAMYKTFDVYHRSAYGTMSRINGTFGTTSSEYTSTFTKVVLDTISDSTVFEPIKDYHPATKKYVDDKVSGLATTEYVDSKSLPILFLDDSNRTGDKLFPLLPEHNLVFIAGDAQFTDENGNINIIYGLCYSDLQTDGSKLLTEYRTSKSASIAANGTLKSFDYIDEYTKTILTLFKNAPSGKVLVKNKNNTFEWVELPSSSDLSSYAPITSPVFKKSIRIGDVDPEKTLGENSIIVSSYGEASGIYTLSNGKAAAARANYSHAEGYASMTKGIYSHAEGEQTGAEGQASHSEGNGATAKGIASHAEGYYTTSNGKYSHAEGYKTIATGDNQHVQGKYNIEDKANKYAHIVGNGYRDELNYVDYRSNAYTLDWSGNGWFAGKVTQEGTPTNDKDLVNKKYVDDKTSMENVIYEGNGTGPDAISDYWTDCPVSKGNGCWVINKQIEFDSSKPNPYYLLCDNTLYSPENSTFDKTNSAWIYPKVPNTGTIFICNKYNGENKLVLPWDDVNTPGKIKLYTKTELAAAISDGDLEATSDEVKAMLANVLGGDYSGKKN